MGDKDLLSGEIDDLAISNNGDSEKILATVVGAVYAFCEKILKLGYLPQEVQLRGQGFI